MVLLIVCRGTQAAIQGGCVIVVIVRVRAVGDKESIPKVIRLGVWQGGCPVIAGGVFQAVLITGDIRGGQRHWNDRLSIGIQAVDPQVDACHIAMEGPEADRDGSPGRDRAAWRPVEGIARIMAQAVPFNVVIGLGARARHTDRGRIVSGVETEGHNVSGAWNAERNIVRAAAHAVVGI